MGLGFCIGRSEQSRMRLFTCSTLDGRIWAIMTFLTGTSRDIIGFGTLVIIGLGGGKFEFAFAFVNAATVGAM